MLPPGPTTPALVQMIRWMRSPARALERVGATWGEVFTTRSPIFGTSVNFTHPDAVKEIFTGDPAVFHAGEVNQVLGVFVGWQSVLLLDDAAHVHTRRLMLPAFHGERMQTYTVIIREATRRAVAALRPGQRLGLHAFFRNRTGYQAQWAFPLRRTRVGASARRSGIRLRHRRSRERDGSGVRDVNGGACGRCSFSAGNSLDRRIV
jgi:hypothetical protein